MAAQNYFTGDSTMAPHPQLQNVAPPPYTAYASSPRPQPSPLMSGGLGAKPPPGRDPSPYRLPPQQQPQQQQRPAPPPQQQQQQWPNQQGYRPSQHYYQPHSQQQYPSYPQQPQQQQQHPQVHFARTAMAYRPRRYASADSYSRPAQGYPPPNPYPPGMQQPRPSSSSQQNLHPQHAYGPQRPTYYNSNSDDRLDDRPHRHHKHSHHQSKPRSKSDNTRDTFLGAGSGAILGDVLIGPGVGTAGAAIIGGLLGNKHANDKHRRRSGSGSGSGSGGRRHSGRRDRSLSRDSRDSRY